MASETRESPRRIIFGTDWWTDCDDIAALDILLGAHQRGQIDLKAIGVSSVMRYSAPSVKALCEQHGLDGIPIGIDRGAERKGIFCLYQKKLAAYCRSGFTNGDCPEAYQLYRSVLSSAPEKAVIVDVGFPQIVMELLRSGPDEYSESSGLRLVEEKVSEIILMGGRWDRSPGREYNFCAYRANREAAAYLCENSPVPLTFLGYEVGKDVVTGGKAVKGLTGIAYAAHRSPAADSSACSGVSLTLSCACSGCRRPVRRSADPPRQADHGIRRDRQAPQMFSRNNMHNGVVIYGGKNETDPEISLSDHHTACF